MTRVLDQVLLDSVVILKAGVDAACKLQAEIQIIINTKDIVFFLIIGTKTLAN